jgi:molecular chaperone GrpE
VSNKVNKDWKKFKEENMQKEEFGDDEFIDELLEEESTEVLGLEHPNYAELEEKLTLTEKQMHENWEKAARAMAELENVRRRAEKDISSAHKFGVEKFINGLLPVVDSLEQAIQLANKDNNASMHEGLDLTMKLFLDVLAKNGVVQIDPMGEVFNPEFHEAMSMQEVPDVKPNTVIVVFQKGYKLHDRVIRAARVVVAK